MNTLPAPRFEHLLALSDRRGTFEHAELASPRRAHGYCTDDVARVLVVVSREPSPAPSLRALGAVSLRFLADAQTIDGRCRNRMDQWGRWSGAPSVDDCWGRSIWALGTAAASSDSEGVRQTALALLQRASHQRSPWPRAMAYAAIGAAELLAVRPSDPVVRGLLVAAADGMAAPAPDQGWPWPEARLSYANAVLPEAMIAAGTALDRASLVADGLALLAWLLDHESHDGRLSPTPVGGGGHGDRGPAFDQQPIEVAALAEACARAAAIDGGGPWAGGIDAAVAWFLGDNDVGVAVWDPETGAGYDGLEPAGVNRNRGAESTLAVLSTLQHGRRLVGAAA